jgi:hypothetical protein
MLAQSSLLLILLSKDGPQFPPEIVNPNPLRNKAFFSQIRFSGTACCPSTFCSGVIILYIIEKRYLIKKIKKIVMSVYHVLAQSYWSQHPLTFKANIKMRSFTLKNKMLLVTKPVVLGCHCVKF